MSNRNFDASTVINILKAQMVANFQNRKTDMINMNIQQIPTNPQSANYSNDVITEVDAGSQAYYLKGYPLTTVVFPVSQPLATPYSPPPPSNYHVVIFASPSLFTWIAPANIFPLTITYFAAAGGSGAGGSAGGAGGRSEERR